MLKPQAQRQSSSVREGADPTLDHPWGYSIGFCDGKRGTTRGWWCKKMHLGFGVADPDASEGHATEADAVALAWERAKQEPNHPDHWPT